MLSLRTALVLIASFLVFFTLSTDAYAVVTNVSVSPGPIGQQTTVTGIGSDPNGISSIGITVTSNPVQKTCTISPPSNWANCVLTTSQLSAGQHTATVTATNTQQQTATASQIFTISTDTSPPNVGTVSVSPSNPSDQQTVTLYLWVTDNYNVADIKIYLDNQLVKTCTFTSPANIQQCNFVTSQPLSASTHTVYATATDFSNNRATGQLSMFSVTERTPPVVTGVTFSPSSLPANTPFSITATATDNTLLSKIEIYVNIFQGSQLIKTCPISPVASSGTCSYNHPPIIAGKYDYMIFAYDTSGNIGSLSNSFLVGNDNSPPSVTVSHGSIVGPGGPVFTVSASDDTAVRSLLLVIDNNVYTGSVYVVQPPSASVTYSNYFNANLAQGTHTYYAEAYDTSGNKGTSSTGTFTMPAFSDTTNPTITPSVSPSANIVTGQGITLSASANDDNGVARIRLEGSLQNVGPWFNHDCNYGTGTPITQSETCSKQFFFSTPVSFNFIATAYDTSNNVMQSSPISITISADTQNPTGTITHSPAAPTAGQSVVFKATGQDNGFVNQIDIFVDNTFVACCGSGTGCQPMTPSSSPAPCTYSQVMSAPGQHTYKVRVWDGALNSYISPQQTFNVLSDTQRPIITKADFSFPSGITAPVGTGGGVPVQILAQATDNIGVTGLYIYIDSQLVHSCPYSPSVQATPQCVYSGTVTNGPHSYEVIALDSSSNQATTGPKPFTTDNNPPHVDMSLSAGGVPIIPHVPPLLPGMTNPTGPSGTPVSVQPKAPLTFIANAQDDVAISVIFIYVGGSHVATCTSSPCSHTLSLTAQGLYSFYAEAYDTSNNKAQTMNSFFYVGTPPATPPPPPPAPVQIIVPIPQPAPPSIGLPATGTMTCTCKDRLCSLLGAVVNSPPSNCAGWCTALGNNVGLTCDAYTAVQTPVAGASTYQCTCDRSVCQSIPPATFPSSTFTVSCMNYCLSQTISRNLMAQGAFCM